MNLKGIWTIFMKELKVSSKSALILFLILIPIVISLVMTVAMGALMSEVRSVAIGVHDSGNNSEFINYLSNGTNYNVWVVGTSEDLKNKVELGELAAGLELPANFTADLRSGARPDLNITIDPSNKALGVFTGTYMNRIVAFSGAQYPVNVNMSLSSQGTDGEGGNDKGDFMPYTAATWVVFTVVMIGSSILPQTLTTERERRTLDAMLVTPISESDVILGKTIYGFVLTFVVSILILVLNNGMGGNLPLTLVFVALGSLAFTGLGLLIASAFYTYSSASIAGSIVTMPMLLMTFIGGITDKYKWLSYVSPGTFMQNGIDDAMKNAGDMTQIGINLGVLALVCIAVFGLTIYFLRRRRNAS